MSSGGTTDVLPNETILPDVFFPPAHYLKLARKWADCPHRYFVDDYIHKAKLAGEVDATEVWAIYEVLQKAEKRGYKEIKRVDETITQPHAPRRRRAGHGSDAA